MSIFSQYSYEKNRKAIKHKRFNKKKRKKKAIVGVHNSVPKLQQVSCLLLSLLYHFTIVKILYFFVPVINGWVSRASHVGRKEKSSVKHS